MRPFTEDDFPIKAIGHCVYRQTESSPICICTDQTMSMQIALRMNRDNCANPEALTTLQPSQDTMAAQPEKPSCFDTSAPKRQP